MDKTNALRGRISNFQQTASESIPEVWERLQEYILACPHHGMENRLILQNFYNGLTSTSRAHIDAAVGGAFFSLIVNKATTLIKKMVSNQGWSEDRLQTQKHEHAYHRGNGYAGHRVGSLNKTLGQAWWHKRSNLWYHPIAILAYTMRDVRRLQTFGERLPQNPGRCVVQQLQRVLSTRRSRVESVATTKSGR